MILFHYLFYNFMQFLVDHGVSVAVVATKIDKLSSREATNALRSIRTHFGELVREATARCAHQEGFEEDGAADDTNFGDTEPGVGAIPVEVPVIPFSSVTGQGKSELWKVVRDNMITTAS